MRESRAHPDHSASLQADCVARATKGDLDAFDQLVNSHQDRIFNLCLWVIGDRDDAADATQEAFLRAFRYLKKFRGDASFSTWLGRIAMNVARDSLARRKKNPQDFSSLAATEEETEALFPQGDTASTEDKLLRHERQHVVRQALTALPDHHRIVLVLFELQGMAYEEVATLLNLPVGTVKSRINRARAALRESLSSHRELFDPD